MQVPKIRVAVLFGGQSAEHEVSLQSAKNVIQYLDTSRFEVIPVGISKQGHWFVGQDVFQKSLLENQVTPTTQSAKAWFSPDWICKHSAANADDIKNLPIFDVVFPAVHGTACEDGTLQGLLELANVPYVGCGVLASAMGMDKVIAKKLVELAGVPIAPYVALKIEKWQQQSDAVLKEVQQTLNFPVFVKPANAGSSVGISKVKQADQLRAAIDQAFLFDTKILIEKALDVLELEMAVLESLEPNADPIVSIVGEIKPTHEFYSYDAKYIDEDGAQLCIPASVPVDIQESAREMAKIIFEALECEGMARVDLFYDKAAKQIVFNEINTLPGFTKISMYPKLMGASGMSYTDLLSHLVALALKRQQLKNRLVRSYGETAVVE